MGDVFSVAALRAVFRWLKQRQASDTKSFCYFLFLYFAFCGGGLPGRPPLCSSFFFTSAFRAGYYKPRLKFGRLILVIGVGSVAAVQPREPGLIRDKILRSILASNENSSSLREL